MTKDLTAAFRSLRRAPGFTALVVLTLALGIGATTAMFSVVDAVLINPLPFANADRLSEIWTSSGTSRRPGGSVAVVQALRRESTLFSAVEAYQMGAANVTGDGEPEIVGAPMLSPGLVSILGPTPLLGRLFTQEDAASGNAVLLSERFWTARYGANPLIVGREIEIDERPHYVVGVLPERFKFPEASAALWRVLDVSATAKPGRVQVTVVRSNGVTPDQANDRLQALAPALRESGAIGKNDSLSTDLLLQQRFGRQSSQALYLMFGAVAVVLLVACVNVTNLMLVRSSARRGELALMTALGAGRGQLVRSVLVESVVLAAAGCAAGLLLARTLLALILGMVPSRMTYLNSATAELDWRALAFAAVIATATCVTVGLLPAWRTARIDAIDALKQRAQGVIGSHDDWWQGALVVGQLALVLMLLAGSGLLWRSFARLVQVDPGYDVDRVSVVEIQLQGPRYAAPGASLAFMQELERNVEASGVAAAISGGAPPTGGGFAFELTPEAEGGRAVDFSGISLPFGRVAPDYFETLGIAVLQGRTFAAGDGADAVIVNDVLARRFWGDASPVGRRFRTGPQQPWSTVIGVVADVKQMGPADAMGEGMEFYQPFTPTGRTNFFALVVRSKANPEVDQRMIKQQVWRLDPKQPVLKVATMAERLGDAVAGPRFFLSLASAFAITASLLAAIGVYGVSAYWVSRRRRELAIRIALGASRDQVMTMVVARSLKLALLGCLVGLGLAWWGAKAIESMLFQVDARDPVTLIGVAVSLGLLALIASALPALKASRVDPMSVLRAE